ncbi:rhamnan synthesis F family protein [Candidatus Merdisoma sp. JLR.KK011]|uniref:rhamnan synthesis F family protein n=1 Tax=Candidatus Merdisoma sp. JLR.KK011 TaxID=3114299 RepID=UPI002FF2184B
MKRLGIYVIYDAEGTVDPYIERVLKEIKSYLAHLIVVCNFPKIKKGTGYLEKYADKIVCRDNRGYDAGAYKDMLMPLFASGVLEGYEELLLANDTFYGPLYPFYEMFCRMEQETCDFWGVTRHPGNTEGMADFSHIQSYFLVFKKRLLHSRDFYDFWNQLKYPEDHLEAICFFELDLNRYLKRKMYIGKSYMDWVDPQFQAERGNNPYGMHALELIRDMKIPVMKRKALSFDNKGFLNALQAFGYIGRNLDYNVSLIENHIRRIHHYAVGEASFDYEELEAFYETHERVFLYGNGIWGKNLDAYFQYKGWKLAGHFVTYPKENENCLKFSETELSAADGIIIAVGTSSVIKEIRHTVLQKCRKEQVLSPKIRD